MLFPLYTAQIDLTNRCNLRCKHCRNTYKKIDLKLQVTMTTLDELNKLGVQYLILSGGEPFIRKDIFKIITRAYNKTRISKIILTTNGTLITEEIAQKLKNYSELIIQVSLDGNEAVHELIRGKSSFSLAVGAIKKLVKNKNIVQIKTVLSTINHHVAKDIIDLAKELDVKTVLFRTVIPVGNADKKIVLDFRKYWQLMKALKQYGKKCRIEIISGDPCVNIWLSKDIKKYAHNKSVKGGCLAGRSVLYINHQGKIGACSYLPLYFGDVYEETIKEAIKKIDHTFENLTANLTGRCSNCKYGSICNGCRAMAFYYNKGLFEEDPRAEICSEVIT